jgi:tRNA_anti-like
MHFLLRDFVVVSLPLIPVIACETRQPSAVARPPASAKVPQVTEEEPRVDAEYLWRAFQADRSEANGRYRGKTVQLTGWGKYHWLMDEAGGKTIARSGGTSISFSRGEFSIAHCAIPEANMPDFEKVYRREAPAMERGITVRGECTGSDPDGVVMLRNSQVMTSD